MRALRVETLPLALGLRDRGAEDHPQSRSRIFNAKLGMIEIGDSCDQTQAECQSARKIDPIRGQNWALTHFW